MFKKLQDQTVQLGRINGVTGVKILKFRTPRKLAVITLKVEQDGFSLE